jgi:hypothetical protein
MHSIPDDVHHRQLVCAPEKVLVQAGRRAGVGWQPFASVGLGALGALQSASEGVREVQPLWQARCDASSELALV